MSETSAGIQVVRRFDGVEIRVPPPQTLNAQELSLHALFWCILAGGVFYGLAPLVWAAFALVVLVTVLYFLRQRAWRLILNGRTLQFWQDGWQSVPLEEIQGITWTEDQEMRIALTEDVLLLTSLSPLESQQAWLAEELMSAANTRRETLGIGRDAAPARPPPELEALRGGTGSGV